MGCIALGPSYSLLGLDLGRILRAGEAKGRGDGIADGRSLCSAVASIRQDRPQFGMYLKEEVPVGAVRFRRVVRDLNYQRGRGGDIKSPEHAERIVPVERLGLAVAQIGGDAVRLLSPSIALEHDASKRRLAHLPDCSDRNPLGLFDDALRHLDPMPLPPAPTRGVGRSRANGRISGLMPPTSRSATAAASSRSRQ
jgi:hypothetical protein